MKWIIGKSPFCYFSKHNMIRFPILNNSESTVHDPRSYFLVLIYSVRLYIKLFYTKNNIIVHWFQNLSQMASMAPGEHKPCIFLCSNKIEMFTSNICSLGLWILSLGKIPRLLIQSNPSIKLPCSIPEVVSNTAPGPVDLNAIYRRTDGLRTWCLPPLAKAKRTP